MIEFAFRGDSIKSVVIRSRTGFRDGLGGKVRCGKYIVTYGNIAAVIENPGMVDMGNIDSSIERMVDHG